MTSWFILRTATRQEHRATASLDELKIEHYLPTETVMRKMNRQEVAVERPLYPGYLFALISDAGFHAAIHANGVHAPVLVTAPSGERVPAMIPAALVTALREAQAAGEFDRTRKPPEKPMEFGESLRITTGPFEGHIGALMELRPRDRMTLLINSNMVEVDLTQVERAA